jgi:hypothetical protein
MTISNTTYASVGQAQRLRSPRPLETVSRVVGAHAPQTLSAAAIARDVKTGVVSSIPFDALFSSQEYRRGEITAKQYVAKTLNFSISAASWTLGGTMMGALLAPVGLPAFVVGVAGFATGMVANEIWLRTAGKPITKAIEAMVPEALAETVAEVFTKAIANPLYDAVWKPLTQVISPVFRWAMQNKVTAGAALGGLALAFPNAARAIAPEVATMAAGTAAGIAFTGKVLDPILPPVEEMSAPAKAPQAKGAGQAAGLHFARVR